MLKLFNDASAAQLCGGWLNEIPSYRLWRPPRKQIKGIDISGSLIKTWDHLIFFHNLYRCWSFNIILYLPENGIHHTISIHLNQRLKSFGQNFNIFT